MPIGEKDSSFQRAVDSLILIRTARVGMVVASLVGLPAAGYGIKRIINSADELTRASNATATKLDLLEQSVRLTFSQKDRDTQRQDVALTDHELRLRVLERERRAERGGNDPGVGHN